MIPIFTVSTMDTGTHLVSRTYLGDAGAVQFVVHGCVDGEVPGDGDGTALHATTASKMQPMHRIHHPKIHFALWYKYI